MNTMKTGHPDRFLRHGETFRRFLTLTDEDRHVIPALLAAVVLIVLCFLPSRSSGATDSECTVTVRPFSLVPNRNIILGDVADIKAPADVRDRLSGIRLGASPKPGKQKRIPGSMVESKIRSLSPTISRETRMTVPKIFVVERPGQELTEPELKALFYSHIEKKVEGRPFRLKDVKIRGNRYIPLGSKILKVDDTSGTLPKGRVTLAIRAEVDGDISAPIYISGWVDLFEDVVRAGRDIPKGDTIRREDLRLFEANMSKSPPGLMTSADRVEGSVARSRIGKGTAIRDSMIAEAPVIRKGDVVKIMVNSGPLTVVAQGVSREEGRMGQQIMVQNIRSNKNIPARVVGPGAVEVLF